MTRAPGFYPIQRVPEEPWTVAQWRRDNYGNWRWMILGFNELHRGRVHRVGKRIEMPA